MGTLTFDVFGIWLIVAAVFVGKFGNGRLKVGSLSLDQAISVLSGASFTFAFVHLLTSVQFWHIGAYLAFLAALIAFFAGVFTMIPFFGKEFAVRDEVAAHPKARPVTKRSPHPAPVANMPGAHNGPGGFGAPYGSQPNGPIGSQGQPGAPGHPGQPGGPGQFGQPSQQAQPGQPGQQAQPGQPGQFAAPGQSAPGGQFAAPVQNGQPDGHDQFGGPGQPDGQAQFGHPIGAEQNNPYAPPEQQAQETSFDSATAAEDSADQSVQSTGSGQTYLGAQHSQEPQHTQSEPTQTFGFGAHREESPWSNDGETAVQAPVPADSSSADSSSDSSSPGGHGADSLSAAEANSDSENEGSSGAGMTAAVAGAGAVGVGAAAAGVASANSESERRRGRHAAPDSDTESGAADSHADRTADGDDRAGRTEDVSDVAATSTPDGSPALTDDDSASPAESSSLATKVNAHDSEANIRASEGVALKPESDSADAADSADSANAADSADAAASTNSGEPVDPSDSDDSANVERTEGSSTSAGDRGTDAQIAGPPAGGAADEATVVNGPAATTRGAAESGGAAPGSQSPIHPEADEPTQYVPVAGYGTSGSETGEASGRGGDSAENAPSAPRFGAANASSNASSNISSDSSAIDDEETVVQSAVQPGGGPDDREDRSDESRNDADQDGSNRGASQNVIQAFWFAVPEPREAVDPTTGMPVFTIYPGDWFLGLEDNGSWFKVRDSDGREGLLRNTEGVQRG
ncbi:hypothetical protein GCM10009691_09550 [Brevibacterium picturae]|uniref:SH3 domain-containing protein n=2 Tax=Brevibacterium picturae TaxID=260553 RepID=A0ABP4M3B5_9MICO